MLEVDIATRCEVGSRRHNEDDLRHGENGLFCYAVLADGAGGHKGGAIASDIVVRMIALGLQTASQATPERLTQLVQDANRTLNEQRQMRSRDGMYATLVALWIDLRREEVLWTHVGDSRLYMLRNGRVCHVSRDDSLVQKMVDAGLLTQEEAQEHPKKNQLLCAMGADGEIEPHTTDPIPLHDGDAFLLCSDGWWDLFDNQMLEESFAAARTPEDWLDDMAERIQRAERPRQDNYSAVAVWVGDPAEVTRAASLWEP